MAPAFRVQCGDIELRLTLNQNWLAKPLSAAIVQPFLKAFNKKKGLSLSAVAVTQLRINGANAGTAELRQPASQHLVPAGEVRIELGLTGFPLRPLSNAPRNTAPDEEAVARASMALMHFGMHSEGLIPPNVLFRAVLGWPEPHDHPPKLQRLLRSVVGLMMLEADAVFEALKRWLPIDGNSTVSSLQHVDPLRWTLVKELHLAKLFVDDSRVHRAGLQQLADPTQLYPRQEWEKAFGIRLPRCNRWCAQSQLDSTSAAAGDNLASLSLEKVLSLSQPAGGQWHTQLCWFIHSNVHFAEALTKESVLQLGRYLLRRQTELGCSSPVVEIGAGDGRLAYHLNRTVPGLHVVATDPWPNSWSGEVLGVLPSGTHFPVERIGGMDAIRKYSPALLLCAWMTAGEDWTPAWCGEGVAEYVLVGDLGRERQTGGEYSLLREHKGWVREILPEVSAEMLTVYDAFLRADGGGGT